MSSTAPQDLQITVNGEARPLAGLVCVQDLVGTLGLDTRKVAIERNQTLIPRSLYATTPLAAGDAIEIVGFIGGG